jgi:hypothetical protein
MDAACVRELGCGRVGFMSGKVGSADSATAGCPVCDVYDGADDNGCTA